MLPFALNHMTAPRLGWQAFADMAQGLGCVGVEYRNDLPGPLFGGADPAEVGAAVRARGLKDSGVPLILVSHNLQQVFDLVDRIVVFRRGRIVASLRRDETDGNDIVSYITGVKGNAETAYA